MDELIDEMDFDEVLREAESDLKLYNAISRFVAAREKFFLDYFASRRALADSMRKAGEALTQFAEAFQLCKFRLELDEVIFVIPEEDTDEQ